MHFIKVSFFALSLGILCYAARPPILQYHDFGHSAETTPVRSDCICLPKVDNAQLLPDMIVGDDMDLERLVVYFYINPQTKKIAAYTPNVAKQQIFTDLSFDVGDELQPIQADENINNIVILNPNKIERIRDSHESINYLQIDDKQNPREFITNAQTDSVNIAKDKNYNVIAPLEENTSETNEILNNVLPPENNAEIHLDPNANIEVKDNINLETLDSENIFNNLIPAQESGVISLQNINQIQENTTHVWKTHSINDNNGIWNNYILKDEDHHVEEGQDMQRPGYLNFNQWFEQQMDSSINKQMQNVNFPDNGVLKNLIYKTLSQNGMTYMGNGKFKTHQGDILNLSNLKLQPIFVGVSLGYNYLNPMLHGKMVHPYFNAMILYMTHPQRVLGIIPISSAISPESMDYTTTKFNKLYPSIMSSTVVKTHCFNGKCYTKTIPKKSPWKTSRLQKKEAVLSDIMNDPSTHDLGAEEILKHNNRLSFIKQLQNMNSKMKSKDMPVINDLWMKYYNILVSDKADKIAGKKTPKYEVHTIEDGGPDIRIVGGSAATGSGTPISSRGRSAFD